MAEKIVVDRAALAPKFTIRRLQVSRVPEVDGRDEQVETGRAEELVLEGAVAHLAEPAEVDSTGKRIPCLALVQPEVGAPAQIRVLDPVEREQRALDASDFPQRLRQTVLARIGRELLQDRGRAFEFRGGGAVNGLLRAIAVIREMYRRGKRTLSANPPTAFVRRAWRSFVFEDGAIDRKAYELCALSALRDRLRAGDVWVDGSRQYQDFESYLIPKPTFEILKSEGPLPLNIETDIDRYLEDRRAILDRELSEVAALATAGKLEDVDLFRGRTEDHALAQRRACGSRNTAGGRL